jgi:hypothetical protein
MSVFDKEEVHDELKAVHCHVLWWDLLLETLHRNSTVRVKFNCLELLIKGNETVMAYTPTILSAGRTQRILKKKLHRYLICSETMNLPVLQCVSLGMC